MLCIASTAQAQRMFDSPERVDATLSLERNGTVGISIYSGRVNVTGATGSSVRIRGTAERDEMQIRSRSGMISVSLEPDREGAGARNSMYRYRLERTSCSRLSRRHSQCAE